METNFVKNRKHLAVANQSNEKKDFVNARIKETSVSGKKPQILLKNLSNFEIAKEKGFLVIFISISIIFSREMSRKFSKIFYFHHL